MTPPPALGALRQHAHAAAERSVVPFSGEPEGTAFLFADGRWVAGARVESGSFPLSIPALQAAYAIAAVSGRTDVVAVALNRPLRAHEAGWLHAALGQEPDHVFRDGFTYAPTLPEVGHPLPLALDVPPPDDDAAGLALAREAARHALVPHSAFPVGCVLVGEDASGAEVVVAGANVEHEDWTRGLCAERVALARAVAAGAVRFRRAYLTCPAAPGCSPCGGCRQVLAEHLREVPIVMNRGGAPPEIMTPAALLPHNFTGDSLRR